MKSSVISCVYLLFDRDTSILLIELFIAYTFIIQDGSNGVMEVLWLSSAEEFLFQPVRTLNWKLYVILSNCLLKIWSKKSKGKVS